MFIRQVNFLLAAIASASMAQPSAVLPIGTRRGEMMIKLNYVNVTLPWMGDANIPANILFRGDCHAVFPDTVDMTPRTVHDIFLPSHIDGTLVRTECEVHRQPPSSSDMSVFLGIGPGSPLVRNTGSVDVIWKNSESAADSPMALVLNSSTEWFNSVACETRSLGAIPAMTAQHTVSVSAVIGDRNITVEDQ